MVKSFNFSRLPLIYFGTGNIDMLAGIVFNFGRSAIAVTGTGSFSRSQTGKQLFVSLEDKGIKVRHIAVKGEPSPELIDRTVAEVAGERVDVVFSVGGGSAIDAGKAVSAMLPIGGKLKDYLEGVGKKEHPGIKVPFIAVPTTAGTGSEATKNAVISEVRENGFKKSLRHENFVPDVAIVDPLLTITCPPFITAASGMDCFTQLLEAYLSDKANPFTDALALEGIRYVKLCLLKAYQNGEDIEARTGMAFAALTSGICLSNAGLGAVHGFASSIGAIFNIPHGIVCGTLMAKSNEINVKILRKTNPASPALVKYSILGEMFLNKKNKPRDYYIDGFTEHLHQLTESLNIPVLGKYGMSNNDAERICNATDIKNNPVRLSKEDLMEILISRI